jgi:hypothetical protein
MRVPLAASTRPPSAKSRFTAMRWGRLTFSRQVKTRGMAYRIVSLTSMKMLLK